MEENGGNQGRITYIDCLVCTVFVVRRYLTAVVLLFVSTISLHMRVRIAFLLPSMLKCELALRADINNTQLSSDR